MLAVISIAGKVLRDKTWCVKKWDAIFLIMDNAGGHGKNGIIE